MIYLSIKRILLELMNANISVYNDLYFMNFSLFRVKELVLSPKFQESYMNFVLYFKRCNYRQEQMNCLNFGNFMESLTFFKGIVMYLKLCKKMYICVQ